MTPGVSTHARARMVERFGRDLARDEWLAVVRAIVEGRALLQLRHDDKEHYLVSVGGLVIRAVWVPASAIIVTVTDPAEMLALKHAENIKRRRLPPSQVVGGWYKGGRKLKARTVWANE